MKTPANRPFLAALIVLASLHSQPSTVFAQGTAFTYQGRLTDNGSAATGVYDLAFALFGASGGGSPLAGPMTNAAVAVSNGLFTVTLDFGASFPGADRWLEIQVRTNLGAFTTLTPRQALTPAPYALFARTAGAVVNNSVTAGSIAGGQVVKNLNGLKDAVNLVASTNVTLRTNGNNLSLSAGPWLPNGSSTFYNGGSVGIGTATPIFPLHIAADVPVMLLHDTGSDSTQAGYISYRNGSFAETAWVGYGTAGSPDFSIVNARSSGDIVLLPFSGNVGIGTGTPRAKLEVHGDIRLGPAGEFRATSGEENLRIVRGRISGTGVRLAGSGFNILHNATFPGFYQIDFDPPFGGKPAVTVTVDVTSSAQKQFATVSIPNFNSAIFIMLHDISTGNLVDNDFTFIAIGAR